VLRRNWRTVFVIIAVLFDSVAIGLSGLGAYFLRSLLPNVPYVETMTFLKLGAMMWLVLFFWASILGLYRATFHTNIRKQYLLGWKAYFYSILTMLSLFYLLQWSNFPRRFTFLFFLLLPPMFVLMRSLLNQLNQAMQRRGYGVWSTLVFGYENSNLEVLERFTGFPELGYELRGIITREESPLETHLQVAGRAVPKVRLANLPNILKQIHIDRVFIPSAQFVTNGSAALMDLCRSHRIKLKILSPESDNLLRMVRIHDIAGITLYSPPRTRHDAARGIAKRIFDVVGSSVLIFLLSPVYILTALAIYAESGRPIVFKQRRSATKGGQEFYFYKFRSMVQNADEMKGSLFHNNESDGALFKLRNDPRLTRVGRFIRKFSIDELPQLFNVLRGDMSLVGPRPLPVGDYEKLNESQEFWEAIAGRNSVKPGITGLWQVSGRSDIGFREMVLLDFYYIENQSLLFDLEILFATVPVVLFGKGAY
jgi:exopolysaccharide biosynthesis polyprenyl glycosylphosphotransferase